VRENPVVVRVAFSGNKKVKDNILEPLVETKSRGVLSDAKLAADVRRMQDYYSRQGRTSAEITPEVQQLGENRVNVVFHIVEGDRTKIASIDFVGNHAYSQRRLRSVIQTRTSNILSFLTKRDVYDQDRLAADEELLRRFYLQNGYADFQVISSDVQTDEAGKYHITFSIDEGPLYHFGAIAVDSSIPDINQDTLRGALHTVSGRTFDSLKVEKTLEDITIKLAGSGYAFATVRPRGDRNYETQTIDVTYVIDEGPRVYVERIDVRGNNRTRDYVIRREFDIAEGDAYNRVLLDRVERRLRNLNLFKQVAITAEPGSGPDQVVVVVNVVEESTGEFSVAGGYATDDGFIAELSLTERNFLGRGQYLRIAVGGSKTTRNFDLSFTEPYFLGRRMPLGFDAYRHTTEAVSSRRPFDQELLGGKIRLGLPITEEFSAELNYKIVQDTVSNSSYAVFANGSTLTSSLGYSLTYSTIDNPRDPQAGLFLRVAQDFAGVGGDTRYIRSTADARYYHELWPESELIGMLKVSGGNITGLGQDVRVLDNFFKGGETVRGFTSMGFGPRTTDGRAIPLGGTNYVAATAEVQFPLPVVPEDFGLRGAVFADAGMLWGVDAAVPVSFVNDTAIRSSVGASILWNSPFGLLRADFAKVLSSQSYDQQQFFRFSAGTQF
jgi:outer membrane protein insertion porin family